MRKEAFLVLYGRLGNHFYILSAANFLMHHGFKVTLVYERFNYQRLGHPSYLNKFDVWTESMYTFEHIFAKITNVFTGAEDLDECLSFNNNVIYFNASYFQTNKYFLAYKEEMTNIFKCESEKVKEYEYILEKSNIENSVFISVRQGDYHEAGFYVLTEQYYIDMYNEYFSGKDIFISCDDIEWAKNNLTINKFNNCNNIYYIENLSALEIYNFAINFKYYVCANSTFSSMCALSTKHDDSISIGVPNISPAFNRVNMFNKNTVLIDVTKEEYSKYIK